MSTSAYPDPKSPWCPDCEAHIRISSQGGKKTCPQCGGTSVFIPRNLETRYMIFFLTGAVFGGLAEASSGLFFLPAIFFMVLGVRGVGKHLSLSKSKKKYTDASKEEPADEKKKSWKMPGKTRDTKARAAKRFSPPPSPPPPPPEFGDN